MIPKNRIAEHPGEILSEEYLKPLGLSQKAVAEALGIPLQRVNEIIKGKRGITPDTAWRLGIYFGTTPEFWMNLQTTHDLSKNRPKKKIQPYRATELHE